jgi:hypothetical protein
MLSKDCANLLDQNQKNEKDFKFEISGEISTSSINCTK